MSGTILLLLWEDLCPILFLCLGNIQMYAGLETETLTSQIINLRKC